MVRWFLFELKKNFLNKKTILFLGIIFLLIGIGINNSHSEKEIINNKRIAAVYNYNSYNQLSKVLEGDVKAFYLALAENEKAMLDALNSEDISAFFKYQTIEYLIRAKSLEKTYRALEYKGDYESYFTLMDSVAQIEENDDFYYPKLAYQGREDVLDMYRTFSEAALYYAKLTETTDTLTDETSFNSATVLIMLSRLFLSKGMCFFLFLLNSGIFCEDLKNGSVKMLVTNSWGRFKYSVVKISSSFFYSILIILIPCACTILFLGSQDHFQSWNHPIYYYQNGITSFTPFYEFDNIDSSYRKIDYSDIRTIHISTAPNVETRNQFSTGLGLTTAGKYTGYLLLAMAIVIIFSLLLLQIICLLVKNQYLAMVVSTGLIVGFMGIKENTSGFLNCINPVSMMDYAALIQGNSACTYLFGIIFLSLFSVFLFTLNWMIFKRRDIF